MAASRNCREECPDCTEQLKAVVYHINKQIWNATENNFERQVSGDLYTVVILCIFASIILLLMVRAIKPSESVDDQVTILLNSMRVRCEVEDNARQKRKLREAKKRAQKWLSDAKAKSVKKLSFTGSYRNRSTSESDALNKENISLKSNPVISRPVKPVAQRAASYQFLPEIVVTTSYQQDPGDSSPSSREYSRASSSPSVDDLSQESREVFNLV
ncbi:hypothetical protein FO519_006573 [Halicephalobus sp. NKZ332]|nr:hypothetical protein FO519_006573 [Halicephalobus sp. NKZ332]